MIFVSVGSMFPFDRFIRLMDDWAAAHPEEVVFAQIGTGEYEPQHMDYARSLSGKDFIEKVKSARVVVSHAGMGNIISSRQHGVPCVLFARHASLGEHTTNHQLHTADRFRETPGLFVADTEEMLPVQIEAAAKMDASENLLEPHAPQPFIDKLRQYIYG